MHQCEHHFLLWCNANAKKAVQKPAGRVQIDDDEDESDDEELPYAAKLSITLNYDNDASINSLTQLKNTTPCQHHAINCHVSN